MSHTKAQSKENSCQVENAQQFPVKRSLSISSSRGSNKKNSGPTLKRYKSMLTCVVCEGNAHGYNFDAITCESCKAFFRRNALRPLERLKCRGEGQCDVAVNIKKRCKKCRLQKCLERGMRKEWILTDKEKEDKRSKIEENRRLRQIHDNDHECSEFVKRHSITTDEDLSLSLDFSPIFNQSTLIDLDWFTIQLIQSSYTQSVELNQIAGIEVYPATHSIGSTLELFRVPLYITAIRLVTYLKQIDEFQQLDNNEQIYLVKLNLLMTCFFHSVYIYDPRTDNYHEPNTTDPYFSGKDWNETLFKPYGFDMKHLRNDLIDIFQSDEVVIKLFLLVLFFSKRTSSYQSFENQSDQVNTMKIINTQHVFTDLLYRYCLQQYGSSKAPILFARYVTKIMKIQVFVDEIKHTIHNFMDMSQVSPLMHSLLV